MRRLFCMPEYFITTFFHQPFGSTCRSTYTDGFDTIEPTHINFVGTLYLMRIRVNAKTFMEQHFAVGTLASCYKEDEIVREAKEEILGIRLATCRQMVSKLRKVAVGDICSCM